MTGLGALVAAFSWIARTSAEAAVIVVIILGVQAALRNRLKPRWRYALWLVLVARLFMPWAPESPLSVFNLVDKARETAPASYARIFEAEAAGLPAASGPAATAPVVVSLRAESLTVKGVLALLWVLGMMAFLARVAFENIRFWRKLRQAPAIEDAAIDALLTACRRRLGVRTQVRLIGTSAVVSPGLFGFLRPRLLLPPEMAAEGNLERLRYVFMHELGHLKRHDVLINWLTTLIQAAHWFNPFLWYGFYRMRIDREPACDALALSCLEPEECRQYGETILDFLERAYTVRRVPGMAGILEDKSHLKRRIVQIALFTRNSYRWSALACLVMLTMGTMALTNATAKEQADVSPAARPAPASVLKQNVQLEFENTSLQDILDFLSNTFQINFVLDGRAVAELEITRGGIKIPSIEVKNVPLSQALDTLTKPLGLAWETETSFVWISSPRQLSADRQLAEPVTKGASPALKKKLGKPVSIEFERIAVADILEFIGDSCDLAFALETGNLDSKYYTIRRIGIENAAVSDVLGALVRQLNLTYVCEGDRILIEPLYSNGKPLSPPPPPALSPQPPAKEPGVEQELKVVQISSTNGEVRAQIQTPLGACRWYKQGDRFEVYELRTIDVRSNACAIYDEKEGLARTYQAEDSAH